MNDNEKPIVMKEPTMLLEDRPQFAVLDATNSPKKSGDFITSESSVTLWFKNPSAFTIKAEVLKNGSIINSFTMLTQDIKELTESVGDESNYVVNFYKQSSTIDSEVVLEGIDGINSSNLPVCSYSIKVKQVS